MLNDKINQAVKEYYRQLSEDNNLFLYNKETGTKETPLILFQLNQRVNDLLRKNENKHIQFNKGKKGKFKAEPTELYRRDRIEEVGLELQREFYKTAKGVLGLYLDK